MDSFRLGHRKTLDGLRGLSILLVYVFHASPSQVSGGFLGVDLFFVLSGFLITTLLLEEWRETGRISLGAFYARRALRLLPALALMLLVLLAVSAAAEPREAFSRLARSAAMVFFYSSNWFLIAQQFPRAELSHAWSLSVEEQFYLVWPLLLILLLRFTRTPKARTTAVAWATLAAALVRVLVWNRTHSVSWVYMGLHFDGLLAGALAGVALTSGMLVPGSLAIRLARVLGLIMLGCLGFLAHCAWLGDPWLYQGGYVAVNLGLAGLVLAVTVDPWAPLRLLFESAPLVWLGRLSYGIYLWHIPAYWLTALSRPPAWEPSWVRPLAYSLALSSLSFYLMERPLLRRYKPRFERVAGAAVSP